MNADPRDRLLEYSLERVYNDGRDVDRSGEIIDAWERGVTGTGLADLDVNVAMPAERRPPYWFAAAAATLLIGWFLATVLRSHDDGPTFVESSAALRVATSIDTPGMHFSTRSSAPAGAWLWLPAERAQLSVPTGHALTVDGPALVRLAPGAERALELELLLGSITIDQPDGARLVCSTGFGTIESSDASNARYTVESIRSIEWPAAETPVAVVETARGAARTAAVVVQSGLSIAAFDGRVQRLVAGVDGSYADPVARVILEERAAEEEFTDLLAMITDAEWEKLFARLKKSPFGTYPDGSDAIERLNELLAARPERWERFEQAARTAFAPDGALTWQREAILYILVQSEASRATDLVSTFWRAAPESFGVEMIVALADRGSDEFATAVAEVIDEGNAQPTGLVLASAYAAQRGDDAGLFHLLAFLDPPSLDVRDLPYTLLAAVALEWLGETEFLTFAHRAVHNEVQDLMAAGALEAAAEYLLPALFFEEHRADLRLSYLIIDLEQFIAERSEELASIEALQSALAGLRTE